MLRISDIDTFTLSIQDGYFYWKVKLKDGIIYQIMYSIEKHITPAGSKSKRKTYFIKRDGERLVFDDEVKKMFNAFIRPYIINGI